MHPHRICWNTTTRQFSPSKDQGSHTYTETSGCPLKSGMSPLMVKSSQLEPSNLWVSEPSKMYRLPKQHEGEKGEGDYNEKRQFCPPEWTKCAINKHGQGSGRDEKTEAHHQGEKSRCQVRLIIVGGQTHSLYLSPPESTNGNEDRSNKWSCVSLLCCVKLQKAMVV